MTNKEIISKFYTAFQNKDFATMQSFYHDKAGFNDPVFQDMNSTEVKAMWRMLINGAKDLEIKFSDVEADDSSGKCRWDAFYTFTQTNRKVHNIIHAEFEFKDGLILNHKDHFDFWRWSRQALGPMGLLLGWSPMIINKVRKTARGRLQKFILSQSQ